MEESRAPAGEAPRQSYGEGGPLSNAVGQWATLKLRLNTFARATSKVCKGRFESGMAQRSAPGEQGM